MLYGLNTNQCINDAGEYMHAHSAYRQLQICKDAGATSVRLNFRLGQYYKNWTDKGADGTFALDKYDLIIQHATDLGLDILALASPETWSGNQAQWEENHAGSGDNTYIAAFAKAVKLLSGHYTQINHWEIWNEPNVWTHAYGSGGSFIYPSNFAALISQCYAALPLSCLLITGGVTSFDWNNGQDYINETYQQGTQQGWKKWPAAYIGQHIYINQGNAVAPSALIKNVFNVPLPVYVTEIGWQTSATSYAVQSVNVNTTYTALGNHVSGIYWFSAQDAPEGNLYFGLYTAGSSDDNFAGTAKPAFTSYQGVAAMKGYPPAYTGAVKKSIDTEWSLSNVFLGTVPMDGAYTQIHQDWVTYRLVKNKSLGPPLSVLTDDVDWNNKPIKMMWFANARAELSLTNGKVRWWDEVGEITL